ncbi:MFS general substrate transporter [Trichoderma citrinoviride]|uniref:MFS general substrate transporter n=1 Tax=Trichoderma citrinoviride TaxID=58853 RepID=A0A2T4B145_9HYPO|nr:MFS general substrate transporter [Trichoderma citrinoviride]PTB63039.1 MFS general substrate transporter [Trichoderma citrinoviride]
MDKENETASDTITEDNAFVESKRPFPSDLTSPHEAPSTSPPPASATAAPDGGLNAWLQVLGGWVVFAATWGLVNAFGTFQTYYQTVMLTSESASTISWIGSLQACLLFLGGFVAGPLFDAGYVTSILNGGLLLTCFGMFMTSLCTTYWQVLLAQGVCVGFGMGISFLPATAIMAQYFQKRRAFAIGIAGTGSPVGGIIFPIIFSHLVPKIGFGWTTRVIAFIILGLCVIPAVSMRPRVPASGRVRSLVDNSAWRDLSYMSFITGSTLTFLVLYTAFFYIQVYDELNHLSSLEFAPYTVTLLNAGSVFGRVLPMYLSDKYGTLNVMIFCTFASGILAFGWMGLKNLGGIVVFTILYGITSGATVTGTPVVIMTQTPDASRVGTRLGMAFVFFGVAILVGTPIAGAIFGEFTHTRWLGGIGFSAGGLILGTVFMCVAWFPLRERKGTWKV